MIMRGLTAGNAGKYATGNAVEWGLCQCGAGTDDGDEEEEVPLFQYGPDLLCSSCCAERDDWARVLYVPTWGYDCDEEATGGKAFTDKQSEATRRTKKDAHARAAWMREHGERVIVVRLRPKGHAGASAEG